MAKQGTSLNPNRVGLVLVSFLMLIFLIWAVRSCGGEATQTAMVVEQEVRQNYLDSLQRAEDSLAVLTAAQAEADARAAALRRAATQPLVGDSVLRVPATQVVTQEVTKLYVTFEELNVRSGPGLNYGKIARLKLYDELIFLNEVTDSSYQLNLGEITTTEPWVKVRTPEGKDGWVYGAGVDFYKRKVQGVEY